jgi:hypothetical protein
MFSINPEPVGTMKTRPKFLAPAQGQCAERITHESSVIARRDLFEQAIPLELFVMVSSGRARNTGSRCGTGISLGPNKGLDRWVGLRIDGSRQCQSSKMLEAMNILELELTA